MRNNRPPKHAEAIALTLFLALSLQGCAGSAALEGMLSADPNASRWQGSPSPNQPQVQLPANFPSELRFPNATLLANNTRSDYQVAANPTSGTTAGQVWQQTRWSSPDPSQRIKDFYLTLFRGNGWRLLNQSSGDGLETLTARKDSLQVVVTIPAQSQPGFQPSVQNPASRSSTTEFTLQYALGASSSGTQIQGSGQTPPQPGDPNFIGPVAAVSPGGSAATNPGQSFSDLGTTAPELQSYVQDLSRLGVLTASKSDQSQSGSAIFNPNQPINRRTFARWLVITNNRIYRDRPARQIRLAQPGDAAIFRDVPSTDPDFPYIQGLAAAGYIPSSLTGSTQLQFQPNAPLSRETLLQWKVPVDLRQTLPTATIDGVKQAWGFKDGNRISPEALQAVLADYQNGDLSNIRRLFGSTLLLQPKKPITRAEAAAALWYIGVQGDGFSAQDILRNEQQAQTSNNNGTLPNTSTPGSTATP